MKLIPCAPPRGALNAAPLTTLITPTMQQLETWDGFWGEDDAYYARLSAGDGSTDARWFRVAPEAGTPIQGMPVIGPPRDAHATPEMNDAPSPRTTTSRHSRGVMLVARLGRTHASTHAWTVVSRGRRRSS